MHFDNQVIFIHNPRTSGTAIRRALAHGLDPNRNMRSGNRKHAFASMVRKGPVAAAWDDRFKFSVVRNPHDRMVSLYGLFRRPTEARRQAKLAGASTPYKLDKLIRTLKRRGVSQNMPKKKKKELHRLAFSYEFKPWLLEFCEQYRWNGCRYLDPDLPMTRIQQVRWFDGLDRVFKFEDREEINDCLRSMGYPAPLVENQTEHAPWQSFYDDETFDWVSEVFADDIRIFGY